MFLNAIILYGSSFWETAATQNCGHTQGMSLTSGDWGRVPVRLPATDGRAGPFRPERTPVLPESLVPSGLVPIQ